MDTKKIRKMTAFILSILLGTGLLFESSVISEAANTKKVIVKVGKSSVQQKTYSLQKGKATVLKVPASSRAGQKVKFRSNKKSIVSVDKKGRILAKKKGIAKITITLSGKKCKKRITWVKIKVTIKKKKSPKQTNTPETPVTPIPSVIPTSESPAPEPSQPVQQTPAPTPSLPDGTVPPLPGMTSEPSELPYPVPNAELKVKISVGSHELIAKLENNTTTRALIEKLPITLPMMNLYGREMCYRFDDALPTDNLRSDRYEVGDIVYWPPGHSFVILYKQNGEQFSRQHLGHIDSEVEIFDGIGDSEVTIEYLREE